MCLNRLPHCSVKHELGVGRDKGGGRKPGSRGRITLGEDKVQHGAEGAGDKGGMQKKGRGEGEDKGDMRTEMGHLNRHLSHPG